MNAQLTKSHPAAAATKAVISKPSSNITTTLEALKSSAQRYESEKQEHARQKEKLLSDQTQLESIRFRILQELSSREQALGAAHAYTKDIEQVLLPKVDHFTKSLSDAYNKTTNAVVSLEHSLKDFYDTKSRINDVVTQVLGPLTQASGNSMDEIAESASSSSSSSAASTSSSLPPSPPPPPPSYQLASLRQKTLALRERNTHVSLELTSKQAAVEEMQLQTQKFHADQSVLQQREAEYTQEQALNARSIEELNCSFEALALEREAGRKRAIDASSARTASDLAYGRAQALLSQSQKELATLHDEYSAQIARAEIEVTEAVRAAEAAEQALSTLAGTRSVKSQKLEQLEREKEDVVKSHEEATLKQMEAEKVLTTAKKEYDTYQCKHKELLLLKEKSIAARKEARSNEVKALQAKGSHANKHIELVAKVKTIMEKRAEAVILHTLVSTQEAVNVKESELKDKMNALAMYQHDLVREVEEVLMPKGVWKAGKEEAAACFSYNNNNKSSSNASSSTSITTADNSPYEAQQLSSSSFQAITRVKPSVEAFLTALRGSPLLKLLVAPAFASGSPSSSSSSSSSDAALSSFEYLHASLESIFTATTLASESLTVVSNATKTIKEDILFVDGELPMQRKHLEKEKGMLSDMQKSTTTTTTSTAAAAAANTTSTTPTGSSSSSSTSELALKVKTTSESVARDMELIEKSVKHKLQEWEKLHASSLQRLTDEEYSAKNQLSVLESRKKQLQIVIHEKEAERLRVSVATQKKQKTTLVAQPAAAAAALHNSSSTVNIPLRGRTTPTTTTPGPPSSTSNRLSAASPDSNGTDDDDDDALLAAVKLTPPAAASSSKAPMKQKNLSSIPEVVNTTSSNRATAITTTTSSTSINHSNISAAGMMGGGKREAPNKNKRPNSAPTSPTTEYDDNDDDAASEVSSVVPNPQALATLAVLPSLYHDTPFPRTLTPHRHHPLQGILKPSSSSNSDSQTRSNNSSSENSNNYNDESQQLLSASYSSSESKNVHSNNMMSSARGRKDRRVDFSLERNTVTSIDELLSSQQQQQQQQHHHQQQQQQQQQKQQPSSSSSSFSDNLRSLSQSPANSRVLPIKKSVTSSTTPSAAAASLVTPVRNSNIGTSFNATNVWDMADDISPFSVRKSASIKATANGSTGSVAGSKGAANTSFNSNNTSSKNVRTTYIPSAAAAVFTKPSSTTTSSASSATKPQQHIQPRPQAPSSTKSSGNLSASSSSGGGGGGNYNTGRISVSSLANEDDEENERGEEEEEDEEEEEVIHSASHVSNHTLLGAKVKYARSGTGSGSTHSTPRVLVPAKVSNNASFSSSSAAAATTIMKKGNKNNSSSSIPTTSKPSGSKNDSHRNSSTAVPSTLSFNGLSDIFSDTGAW